MRRVLLLLLTTALSASFSAAQVTCLDLTDTANQCNANAQGTAGYMDLSFCSITDDDVEEGHLAACFDAAGRQNISVLAIHDNELTALPSDIFDDFTGLFRLYLNDNELAALPSGVFDALTGLTSLSLSDNALTTLPSGIFDSLTGLTMLYLNDNELAALPSGVFDALTGLTSLSLSDNALTTLPSGIFDSLTGLTMLWLYDNSLVTLPEGLFDSLTALIVLSVQSNPDLECLPAVPASVTDLTVDDTVDGECEYSGAMGSCFSGLKLAVFGAAAAAAASAAALPGLVVVPLEQSEEGSRKGGKGKKRKNSPSRMFLHPDGAVCRGVLGSSWKQMSTVGRRMHGGVLLVHNGEVEGLRVAEDGDPVCLALQSRGRTPDRIAILRDAQAFHLALVDKKNAPMQSSSYSSPSKKTLP
eukprot:g1599.t1